MESSRAVRQGQGDALRRRGVFGRECGVHLFRPAGRDQRVGKIRPARRRWAIAQGLAAHFEGEVGIGALLGEIGE